MNDHRLLADVVTTYLERFPDRRRDAAEIVRMNQEYRPGQRVSILLFWGTENELLHITNGLALRRYTKPHPHLKRFKIK